MRTILTTIFILVSFISFGQNAGVADLWKLYTSKNYTALITQVKPLLEKEPNNAELNLMMGRSYTDQGNYKTAVPYLESTVTNDNNNSWKKAWALAYLGTCHFMLENYVASEKAVNACIQLNATKNATKNAYGMSLLCGYNDFYKTWKIVESDNFRFHFQNMSDTDMENYVPVREKAFTKINTFFAAEVPKKIDFFVWESREDAKKLLRNNLGFARPAFSMVHSHYKQTVGHEMTHVISHYSTKMVKKTGLINEGTAVCFDLTNQNKEQIVKDWVKTNNKKIDIQTIWTSFATYPMELTYPLSGLFVKELTQTFGNDKFMEFFGNQTYENAKLVFGDKLDVLIEEFENRMNS